jgi:alpha/beta superfamily hydrolase
MNHSLFPLPQNLLTLPGPAGKLEAILSPPAVESASPTVGIICHPHPLHGGTMHNKIVSTLARVFYDLSIWSLRFNFRGVGESEGEYDQGRGEATDLLAIIAWAREQFPTHAIWLAGFSFGAYIAMQGAAHPTGMSEVKRLITVAPAVNHFVFPDNANIQCPWILVMGEKDEIVPVQDVKNWVARQSAITQTLYFPAAGHFFHGELVALREQLKMVLK